jgi:hypothetical protein
MGGATCTVQQSPQRMARTLLHTRAHVVCPAALLTPVPTTTPLLPCSRGRTLTPVYTITAAPPTEEGPCFTARLFLPANTGLPPDVELTGSGSTKSGAAKAAALMALRLLLELGKLDGRLQPTWVSAKHIRSLGEATWGLGGQVGGREGWWGCAWVCKKKGLGNWCSTAGSSQRPTQVCASGLSQHNWHSGPHLYKSN